MKLFLEVKMVDEYGRVHACIRNELPEQAAYMGQRIVDDIKAGIYFDPRAKSPMEAVVKVMQVRELRRGLLSDSAMHAGYQLADFLQDREGWHGADRMEARERILAKPPLTLTHRNDRDAEDDH